MKRVAIIGAGAAGCFCAAQLRAMAPELGVTVFEAGSKPLAKVAITGGGRCNLTNDFEGIRTLADAYPRGERLMKRALRAFSNEDTIRWFTANGVPCVLQDDHCWFPQSQDAMDVVRALLRAMKGADIRLNTRVGSVKALIEEFDAVVVTTGGAQHFPFLEGLDLEIVPPVPSLFTFNIPDAALKALMGLVVEVQIGLQGTSFKADGPLLITDWGLSGPATLKLSAYAARHLASNGYKGTVGINWLKAGENEVREELREASARNPRKLVANTPLLQQRLWGHLLAKAGLREDLRWGELGSKGLNRLTSVLTNDTYPLGGKAKFREEFVTAGGVGLSNIDLTTLECKRYPGLFFAGEVLDIDAITGGFNLQAAWSTGYVCAINLLNTIS
ncbi:MAG: aminoacetone oxidase family FAD-binding enzyme [Bacteroidales bacterium]|nr:aminoacetone oxidase family FAD-binding enzyme [Bacteroidales bacterium]